MNLDINTLFMVTMYVEVVLGLLMFFVWTQNFSKRSLAWWGSAHLLRAASIMLLGLHGSVPDSLSIDVGNAVLFASFALTWSGARVFDQKSPEPAFLLVGVAVWLLACRLPAFWTAVELRILVGSGIVTTYVWLTAFEFWRARDEALVSRWPAILILFTHGALFLLRTPMAAAAHVAPDNKLIMSGWLELLSLESLLFTISIAFILLAMAKERTEHRHRTAANVDPLTGIANRRSFLHDADLIAKRHARRPRPTAVLLIDLDHFKTINDRFGHALGDRVLEIFAAATLDSMRGSDLIGRIGGEEFAAVLHDTTGERALAVAERIRQNFATAAQEVDGRPVCATVSIGVVHCEAQVLDVPELLAQADQALYCAKENGRNRVEVASLEMLLKRKDEPIASSSTALAAITAKSAAA